MIEKPCSRCSQVLPAHMFSPDRRSPSGLQPACKPCCQAARKAARDANPEAARRKRRDYYARNAELVLDTNARSRERHRDKVNAQKRDHYHSVLKDDPEHKATRQAYARTRVDEKRLYDIAYRASIPLDERNAKARAWAKANPDRRKLIVFNYDCRRRSLEEGGCSAEEIATWLTLQTMVCVWCATPCEGDYHIDHVIPLAKGGEHHLHNLAIACPSCNLRKNAKDPLDFAIELHNERVRREILLLTAVAA